MVAQRLEKTAERGERLVAKLFGLKPTPKLAPFDVVDFNGGVAVEVKTVSALALGGSNKIHIGNKAWKRKQDFLDQYGLDGVLVVVVRYRHSHSKLHVEVYSLPLRQHIRISTAIKSGTQIA